MANTLALGSSGVLYKLIQQSRTIPTDHEQGKRWVVEYQTSTSEVVRRSCTEKLFLMYFRLGLQFSKRYILRLSDEERVSLLYLALIKAVEKFDPSHNTNFATYWAFWIRSTGNTIQREAERDTYRIPAYTHMARGKVLKAQNLLMTLQGHATVSDIAKKTGFSPEKVSELLTTHNSFATSLDAYASEENDQTLHGLLADDALDTDIVSDLRRNGQRYSQLFERAYAIAASRLSHSHFDLALTRFVFCATLKSTGDRSQLSRERVRQLLEMRALGKTKVGAILGFDPGLLGDLAQIHIALHHHGYVMGHLSPLLTNIPLCFQNIEQASYTVIGNNGFSLEEAVRILDALEKSPVHTPPRINERTSQRAKMIEAAIAHRHQAKHIPPLQYRTLRQTLKTITATNDAIFVGGVEALAQLYPPADLATVLEEGIRSRVFTIRFNAFEGEAICFLPTSKELDLIIDSEEQAKPTEDLFNTPVWLTPDETRLITSLRGPSIRPHVATQNPQTPLKRRVREPAPTPLEKISDLAALKVKRKQLRTQRDHLIRAIAVLEKGRQSLLELLK